jgi:hypothetical protein
LDEIGEAGSIDAGHLFEGLLGYEAIAVEGNLQLSNVAHR